MEEVDEHTLVDEVDECKNTASCTFGDSRSLEIPPEEADERSQQDKGSFRDYTLRS